MLALTEDEERVLSDSKDEVELVALPLLSRPRFFFRCPPSLADVSLLSLLSPSPLLSLSLKSSSRCDGGFGI